jgi:DNA-binding IscR family transcriptional regulator
MRSTKQTEYALQALLWLAQGARAGSPPGLALLDGINSSVS